MSPPDRPAQTKFNTSPFRAPAMTPEERLQALLDLICEAAPLTWVVNQDMDGAAAWERRAYALLHPTQLVNGDTLQGCDPSAR